VCDGAVKTAANYTQSVLPCVRLTQRRWKRFSHVEIDIFRIIPSSGMLRRVALVGINVYEESIAPPLIRVTKGDELGTLAVTSNWSTLRASVDR
jgi:hypothetical protein